jgi:crotonobetainyl-CoA:carnitine CoA-transferase CaiB-like acyl-CoA transferase
MREEEGGEGTKVGVIGHPIKYSQPAGSATGAGKYVEMESLDTSVTRAAPRLGQHTREVLMEAGYTSEEVDALGHEGAAMVE